MFHLKAFERIVSRLILLGSAGTRKWVLVNATDKGKYILLVSGGKEKWVLDNATNEGKYILLGSAETGK